MKKLLFLLLLFLSVSMLFSQITDNYWEKLAFEPEHFDQIVDTFNTYLSTTYPDSVPQDKLSNIKDYQRFVYFWKSRLGIDSSQASYEPYQKAVINNLSRGYCATGDPANWEMAGPVTYSSQLLGLVRQVLHDPNNPGSYLLASDYGGIWKSRETGNSWENVTDNLRSPGLAISELIRDPNNANHLLASTSSGLHSAGNKAGYGIGIIESFDNGNTWSVNTGFPLVENTGAGVVKVLYSPAGTLYAITSDSIYYSTENGYIWWHFTTPDSLTKNDVFHDIEIADNGDVFLATKYPYNDSTGKIYRYNNSSEKWENIKTLNPQILDFQTASFSTPYQGKIFMHCTGKCGSIVYKTLNDGDTWELLKKNNKPLSLGAMKNEIEYSPDSNIVYSGSDYLYYFKDGVYTLHHFGHEDNMHEDIRDLDFMGIDADGKENILIATDGGISLGKINVQTLSADNPVNLNGNYLPICEFVGFGISHSSPEFIVAGAMHNHTYRYQNGQWDNFPGGDGGDCEINWDNPDIYYYMSNSAMVSSSESDFNYYGPAAWFIGMEYELNPNDPYILYFGRGRISGDNPNAIIGMYNEHTKVLTTNTVPIEISEVGAIGVNTNNEIFVADFIPKKYDKPNRLIKSSDNGDSWEDLSYNTVHASDGTDKQLKQVIDYKTIEDIVFNPKNPDEMWISIGGVQTKNKIPESDKYRVLHSTNGGETWNDYSEGLSAFPVMALEYQAGSDNRLFAGTDAGIYYRDPSMNQWECFSQGLPISIITDLDYDPCSKYLYASAYGRSLYKTYVPFDDDVQTLITGNNVVWDNPVELANDLLIKSGSQLTIKSNVFISEGKKISVEQNARLIVDGGTLTNACGDAWQGIEVWGNTNQHQYDDENGNCAQGKLILKNGATIENAWNAVTNWKPSNWDTRGGIIIATDAHFINNKRSVELMKYQNFDPATGIPTHYRARFTNCEFVYNDDCHISTAPYDHITLWAVNGVTFKGCTFTSEVTAKPNTGSGIYSLDAGYTVANFCNEPIINCPGGGVRSVFNGFEKGIESENDQFIPYQISIFNSDFIDNGTGIMLTSVLAPVIVNDTFELGAIDDGCDNKVGIGIQLNNSKMFAIEQNSFQTFSGAPPAQFIGIRVANTNNKSDEIYKNSYDGLDVSIQAEGKNWSILKEHGLAYYCNDNQNNDYDFYVKRIDREDGIQKLQGSGTMVAGNIFSTNVNQKGNFYNESDYTIDYHYAQNGQNEYPAERENVDVYPEQLSKVCPSHYGDGGHEIRMSITDYQQRETDYNTASASYSNAESQYDAATDTATRDYWADKMSYYNTERARAAYDIIRSDMADTIAHPDRYKTWMEKLNTYATNETMVDYYLQQGDYITALNKVDSLPYRFAFTAYDSTEYPLYSDFKHLQATWLDQGQTVFDLTTTEINSLITIADSSKGTAGAQARAILQFAYPSQYSYTDCIGKPGGTTKSAELNNGSASENSELTVSVKPNPVSTTVTFSYTLPKDNSTGTVVLYDNSGKKVKTIQINNNGTTTLDCSGLSSGIYLYRFTSGSSVKTGKFVIQH